jgi:nucleoside 2-deoxyribosyltransferase
MTVTAYLEGPDVFLPNAAEHAARKVAICQRFGFRNFNSTRPTRRTRRRRRSKT